VTLESLAVLKLFRSTGAQLSGHFRLTSGLHSAEYLQCALVLQHPSYAARLGEMLADRLRHLTPESPTVIVAPALGGLIIGYEVARAFNARFIFTERGADGHMTLRRGFSVEPGERALVVEDVITTGGSTRDVIHTLRDAGAVPLAAGCIIDRSGGHADVELPRVALATLEVVTYDPAVCPLCTQGLPITKPGSRPQPSADA
jgi:orotate phosphoribosyltransferase